MKKIVMKFGGTSVKDGRRIRHVAQIVKERRRKKDKGERKVEENGTSERLWARRSGIERAIISVVMVSVKLRQAIGTVQV